MRIGKAGKIGVAAAILGAVGMAMGLGSALAADAPKLPTADEILAKMKAKWAERESYEMDVKITEVRPEDATRGSITSMHVAAQRWDEDAKGPGRSSVTGNVVSKKAGGKVVTGEMRLVNDGTYAWEEVRGSEIKGIRVTKRTAPKGETEVDAYPFPLEESMDNYDVKVVGEDALNGKKMYVLEGSCDPVKMRTKEIVTRKLWIGEDDLVIWRTVNTFGAGKLVTTEESSSVKVDQKIDPKVFEYTPPAGAVVEDETKGGGK